MASVLALNKVFLLVIGIKRRVCLIELASNWRASEASETLSGVYKFELVRYMCIYIYVWRYICHNSSACHAYVMWAELGHSHFLYVPAVSNVVTNGNGTGTKNVLKETVRLGLSLVYSLLSTAPLLKRKLAYSLPGDGLL